MLQALEQVALRTLLPVGEGVEDTVPRQHRRDGAETLLKTRFRTDIVHGGLFPLRVTVVR